MQDVRRHGAPPFRVAVVHGGPGAAGDAAPVARLLSGRRGVLEPLQTAATVRGQVTELAGVLERDGEPPVVLLGHSWGAWLCCLVAAEDPGLVRKLLLVGGGPFEAHYAERILPARLERLDAGGRAEFESCLDAVNGPAGPKREAALKRLATLAARTDGFDADPALAEPVEPDIAIHAGVWKEAAAMRASGELMARVARIRCPVVAIHGEHDPHPAEGVSRPLAAALEDFRFVPLERCGHTPWIERHARDAFFELVESELD